MLPDKEIKIGYNIYRAVSEWLLKSKLVLKLSPNFVTSSSLIVLGLISYLMINSVNFIFPVLLFQLFLMMDKLDGGLARERNQKTLLGAYLEYCHHLMLKMLIFIIIPFFLYPRSLPFAALGLLLFIGISELRKIHVLYQLGKFNPNKEKEIELKTNIRSGFFGIILDQEPFAVNLLCIGIILNMVELFYIVFVVYGVLYILSQFVLYAIRWRSMKKKI